MLAAMFDSGLAAPSVYSVSAHGLLTSSFRNVPSKRFSDWLQGLVRRD